MTRPSAQGANLRKRKRKEKHKNLRKLLPLPLKKKLNDPARRDAGRDAEKDRGNTLRNAKAKMGRNRPLGRAES
jgi:hypothetical protein